MHKLLKAKQDLIEIQKKRIEYLTNRGGGGGGATCANSNHSTSATTSNSVNLAKQNSQPQQQQQNKSNYQTVNYNQYAHQPKIRQAQRSQIKTQTSITPSASNPSIHTSAANTTSDYSNIRNSNLNLNSSSGTPLSPTHNTKATKTGGTNIEKPITSIAASPSSSSASMTQFCSYLATNSLKGSTSNIDQLQKSKSKTSVPLAIVDNSSSSTSSSSSSSSSSAISTLSSHQNQHLSQSLYHPEVNFLRTSEL
jgi:hypothetical protein